ncbi:MAG: hypothetical protein JJU19_01730 [Pararhodobacter sp.]|nr:hypothetical protein [Pararhodobacter sp.]
MRAVSPRRILDWLQARRAAFAGLGFGIGSALALVLLVLALFDGGLSDSPMPAPQAIFIDID